MNANDSSGRQAEDFRSKPRWSANKKTDVVLRLLRGEPLDAVSREVGVEAHRLAAWRDDFLEHGKQGLKASPAARGDANERRLRQAERKVGELAFSYANWREVVRPVIYASRKRGRTTGS